MTSRTMTVVGALALVAGWLRGGSGLPPAADVQAPPTSRVQARDVVDAPMPKAAFTEQLRLRLDRQPAGPRPSRNPFVFGRETPSAETVRRAEVLTESPDESSLPSGPTFTLSGIAASEVDGRTERTAIISDGRALLFVRGGDVLPGGFVVVSVDEATATLRDVTGGERTLTFRK